MRKFITVCLLLTIVSCSKEPENKNYVIWEGPSIEFVKEPRTNPEEEIHQDRISPSVWITRAISGGQIYNILLEESATKETSPLGTQWAEGEISEISNLTFSPFRTAVGSPKSVVGKKLILHLEEEDVYLPVEFTSWQDNGGGGFSYIRSTRN